MLVLLQVHISQAAKWSEMVHRGPLSIKEFVGHMSCDQ